MTLGRKLLVPYVALALLVGAALAQVTYEAAVHAGAAEREVTAIRTLNEQLAGLNQDVSLVREKLLAYQLTREERFATEIDALTRDIRRTMAEIGTAPMSRRGAVFWSDFVAAQGALDLARGDLISAAREGRNGAAVAPLISRWTLAADQRTAILADFTIHTSKRLDRAIAAFSSRRAWWLFTLGTVIACSILVIVISTVYLRRHVLRPLGEITSTADRITRDEVALTLGSTERDDEIGKLARAFQRMTAHLVAANARLAESVRARDEFLSIASHELKTPISSLKLHLQVQQQRLAPVSGGGAPPKWLEVSLRQLARTESLISALLDVTRIRAGRIELEPRELDLGALVASVLERHAGDLARAGNDVHTRLAPGVVGLWDPGRIDQVVTNLVANVVKHAPGARVEVSVAALDSRAVLVVRDHGPGLSSELEPRLFEKFERSGTARSVGGLGLGLYIARALVSAHRGSISAEETPGGGTTFTVELPVTPAERR